jgi:hypothetical protein
MLYKPKAVSVDAMQIPLPIVLDPQSPGEITGNTGDWLIKDTDGNVAILSGQLFDALFEMDIERRLDPLADATGNGKRLRMTVEEYAAEVERLNSGGHDEPDDTHSMSGVPLPSVTLPSTDIMQQLANGQTEPALAVHFGAAHRLTHGALQAEDLSAHYGATVTGDGPGPDVFAELGGGRGATAAAFVGALRALEELIGYGYEEGGYQTDGPPTGNVLCTTIGPALFRVSPPDQGIETSGVHTGRSRYRVDCLTCAEAGRLAASLVHEATTSPSENIKRHLDEVHNFHG